MADGQLIEFDHATKRFGTVAAVSNLSARVRPGVVTGFLGPNGAGKTTTLRMLLGLERPTSGAATIGGTRYSELRSPARVIGAMLEDPGFRQRRTVERHLILAAKANGVQLSRVGELISFVGLADDVDTRIAALSLGMRQRLSAATALIGDPGVLVLDEPANGLDPEGIRWMRTLIRGLADEGRTVLVSSHVLSEVEQIADEILVIAHGELKFAGTMEDLADPRTGPVVVDAADRGALSRTLQDAGYEFEILRSGLTVRGSDAATIGSATARAGIALTTLQQRGPTLEDVFLDLVHDRYVAPTPAPAETALFELPDASDATGTDVASTIEPSAVAEPVESSGAEPEPGVEPGADAEPESGAEPESIAQPVEAADETPASEIASDEIASDTASIASLFAPAVDSDPVADTSTDSASDASPEDAADATDAADAATDAASDVEREEAKPDERPLPGLSGLAAVASLFASPATEPNTAAAVVESAEAEEPADADEAEESADAEPAAATAPEAEPDAETAAEDSDATRVIDVVPTFDDEAAENTTSETADAADAHDQGSDDEGSGDEHPHGEQH